MGMERNVELSAECRARIDEYKLMHKEHRFMGLRCFNDFWDLKKIIYVTQSRTILDYGCGAGRQFDMTPAALYAKLGVYVESWKEALGVKKVVGYDPASEKYNERPLGTYDGVYCCSVLGYVPEQDIKALLHDIFEYARKFVFISGVGVRPAKKYLISNENSEKNAHATIRSFDWWLECVESVASDYPDIQWRLKKEEEKNCD